MKKRTDSQRGLHFALWNEARAILWPAQESWPKALDDERRHEFYLEELGEFKSFTEFTEGDFDDVKGALLAVIKPGDLNAQLHALNGRKQRLLVGIAKLSKSIGVDEIYVGKIVRTMNAQGKLGSSYIEALHPKDLVKVMIALRQHERRGVVHEPEAAATPVGLSFAQQQRDRRRQHAHVGGGAGAASHPF